MMTTNDTFCNHSTPTRRANGGKRGSAHESFYHLNNNIYYVSYRGYVKDYLDNE